MIDEIQPNQRAILEAYCVPPASKSYLARIPDSEFPRLMSLSPWPRPSLNKNKISSPHPGAVVQPFTWNYAACCHSHIPRHFPFPGPPRLFSSPFAISQQFATDGQACRLAAQKSPVLPRLAALTSGPPADQPQSNNTINASLSMLVVFGSIYLAISPASPLLSFPRSCPDPPPAHTLPGHLWCLSTVIQSAFLRCLQQEYPTTISSRTFVPTSPPPTHLTKLLRASIIEAFRKLDIPARLAIRSFLVLNSSF